MSQMTIADSVIDASTTLYKARTTAGRHLQAVSGACALCGANFAFSPGKHGQRFCSPNCRKKAWLHNHLSTNSLTEIKRALRSLERRVKELENR
jgi:hypothetical protein